MQLAAGVENSRTILPRLQSWQVIYGSESAVFQSGIGTLVQSSSASLSLIDVSIQVVRKVDARRKAV